ncbi:MAG: LytTR family transcriptional regulator DNA-binding domain-containing protein [Bacteroidales bacterium]|nr:LytTR family transcriptional regulator DNA-binding domain-containing protein [Bacteroidales bacterium]
MDKEHLQTIKVRLISVGFSVLTLAVFKPFGLHAWQWEAYLHFFNIGLLGVGVCIISEAVLRYVINMPRSYRLGINYIIRRNLWFQCINTLLVSLMICLYRHFVLSNHIAGNQLSWENFFETLAIMAFCSFAIGLYWRYKFRSRYLAAELEETRMLNQQLSESQKAGEISAPAETVTLTGTTSETVTLSVSTLLYIESVGNYVKVYQWRDGQLQCDMLRATTKQMEDALKPYPTIVRCHRAFLVNLALVEHLTSNSGTMQLRMKYSHDSIPVSRSNMAAVKETINNIGKK